MMREQVVANSVSESANPYSQAVRLDRLLVISGQISVDERGDVVAPDDARGQTQQIMARAGAILREVGCDFSHVARSTIFLKKIEDYNAVNAVYGAAFSEPYPARSTLVVGLIRPEYLVEIEFLAIVPEMV